MKKLFACYLGGCVEGFNIEVHDLVFAVGADIEECLPQLRAKWKGTDHKPHLDSYCEVGYVKGYKVSISDTVVPSDHGDSLFALYLGWSEDCYFGEKHCIEFAAAPSDLKAIKEVNSRIDKTDKIDFHIDNRIGVDSCVNVQDTIENFIELIPTTEYIPNPIINCYKKI
jgi:Domain of Unknown Function (DUF1543)